MANWNSFFGGLVAAYDSAERRRLQEIDDARRDQLAKSSLQSDDLRRQLLEQEIIDKTETNRLRKEPLDPSLFSLGGAQPAPTSQNPSFNGNSPREGNVTSDNSTLGKTNYTTFESGGSNTAFNDGSTENKINPATGRPYASIGKHQIHESNAEALKPYLAANGITGVNVFEKNTFDNLANNPSFIRAQEQFIYDTHLAPMEQYAASKGLDINNLGVRNMLYATGVQFGPQRGKGVADAGLIKNDYNPDPASQVAAINAERTAAFPKTSNRYRTEGDAYVEQARSYKPSTVVAGLPAGSYDVAELQNKNSATDTSGSPVVADSMPVAGLPVKSSYYNKTDYEGQIASLTNEYYQKKAKIQAMSDKDPRKAQALSMLESNYYQTVKPLELKLKSGEEQYQRTRQEEQDERARKSDQRQQESSDLNRWWHNYNEGIRQQKEAEADDKETDKIYQDVIKSNSYKQNIPPKDLIMYENATPEEKAYYEKTLIDHDLSGKLRTVFGKIRNSVGLNKSYAEELVPEAKELLRIYGGDINKASAAIIEKVKRNNLPENEKAALIEGERQKASELSDIKANIVTNKNAINAEKDARAWTNPDGTTTKVGGLPIPQDTPIQDVIKSAEYLLDEERLKKQRETDLKILSAPFRGVEALLGDNYAKAKEDWKASGGYDGLQKRVTEEGQIARRFNEQAKKQNEIDKLVELYKRGNPMTREMIRAKYPQIDTYVKETY